MHTLTRLLERLHIVVVDLKRRITAISCESDDMIIVIVHLHSYLTHWKVMSADIENSQNISFNLLFRQKQRDSIGDGGEKRKKEAI